ncbi:hypothetical protein YB2330_000828 [Saitoella coloradoensis]
MDLTNVIGLKLADLALEFLTMSRTRRCEMILEAYNVHLETDAGRELVEELRLLKKKLAQAWGRNLLTPEMEAEKAEET